MPKTQSELACQRLVTKACRAFQTALERARKALEYNTGLHSAGGLGAKARAFSHHRCQLEEAKMGVADALEALLVASPHRIR